MTARIQSVLFPIDAFSNYTAKKWLEVHGLTHYKVDVTKRYRRYRQYDPTDEERYVTKTLPNRIKLILGYAYN